jgi:multiple sugar transport system ATP-binding protein
MGAVVFDHVNKVYPNGFQAIDDLNLRINDGEFLVLVGPSGCGKSTALRMVAGLEDITSGDLRIGERIVNEISPRDRDIAMVFQNYALYPQMTVADNIAFAMKLRKTPKAEMNKRIQETAKILDLTEYLGRKPGQLSGGQRQRVAMGRAIVRDPQVFLMDEPLSNLDAKLRVQMRSEISRLQRQLGTTTMYVTHDQVEAMTMGDRVAVIKKGLLQQVAEPQELYDTPDNLFVAQFIGSPSMNVLQARLEERGEAMWVVFANSAIKLAPQVLSDRPGLRAYVGREIAVGARPEHLVDSALESGTDPDTHMKITVDLVESLGSEVLIYFGVDAPRVMAEQAVVDDPGVETAPLESKTTVVARLDPRSRPHPDAEMTLAVDTTHLHFFDLDSAVSIRS